MFSEPTSNGIIPWKELDMNEKNGIKKPVVEKTHSTKAVVQPQGQKPGVTKPDAGLKVSDLAAVYLRRKDLFDRQHKAMQARLDAARKNIERLNTVAAQMEQKLAALVAPSSRDFVNPLARALASHFPGHEYEVSGPTGIANAITLSFFSKEVSAEERMRGEKCKSITLVTTKDGGLGVRDYSKDLKTYAPGSVGYASGLQFAVIDVPENATVQWFVPHVK